MSECVSLRESKRESVSQRERVRMYACVEVCACCHTVRMVGERAISFPPTETINESFDVI